MNSFSDEVKSRVSSYQKNPDVKIATQQFIENLLENKYSYNFAFLGVPIIQFPQDIQEIIWEVKPDLIIETGVAHGGSLILSASMLCHLDVMEGLDPRQSHRKVIGVDIDIRTHNRKALDDHPLRFKLELNEGSSIDPEIIQHLRSHAHSVDRVTVLLESNHTHEHVLAELNAYADLVSVGSCCIVFDTVIEDLPAGSCPDRPRDVGKNPKTAVHDWLKAHPEFEIDNDIDNKLLISAAPGGYLKQIK